MDSAFATSSCLMSELTTQQVSSDCWRSSRCVEPVVFAYFSDLNRPSHPSILRGYC
jgi:hypothetical protein